MTQQDVPFGGSADLATQVTRLERATRRLENRIGSLAISLNRVNDLEQSQIELREQTTQAVLSAYEALDELHEARPILADAVRGSVVRQRMRAWLLMGLVAVLACTYLSITGFATFNTQCRRQTYLSEKRAYICDHVFLGDDRIAPGPQYSKLLPKQPPG